MGSDLSREEVNAALRGVNEHVKVRDERIRALEARINEMERKREAALNRLALAIGPGMGDAPEGDPRNENQGRRPERVQHYDPADPEVKTFAAYPRAGEAAAMLEAKTLGAAANYDPAAGWLAPNFLDQQITLTIRDASPFLQLARVVSIKEPTNEKLVSPGGFVATMVSETQTRPETEVSIVDDEEPPRETLEELISESMVINIGPGRA